MQLSFLDWLIIVGYFVLTIAIGLAFSRRAGKSLSEYFVSGRSLPWWIAGTSMVATTFAADTPLAVTGLTIKDGLAGNWFWWAFALGGMITVFVYSRLWRRAEVYTDVELVELRYGGKPASALRGLRAVYLALIVNPIVIGWVTGAMLRILQQTVFFDLPDSPTRDWLVLGACLAAVGAYTILSGLWGVAVNDIVQFVLAMVGCVLLAIVAVNYVGGVSALRERVNENFGSTQAFDYVPQFLAVDPWMPIHVFLIMLLVQWWATWYPAAEPGGGGYIVQRMAACKNERHSLFATLWFQLAHYCIRPWPWIMVAFVALAIYPDLRANYLQDSDFNPDIGFPMVMRDLAPVGLRGLLLVAFFAAFMSTISTQMNWGASYLVRDVYQRFMRPGASSFELTWAARCASAVVLVVGGVTAYAMQDMSVDEAWKMLAALGAGTGAVFMLRWFWWRINAWSEISAMVASLVFFQLIRVSPDGHLNLWPVRVDSPSTQMLFVALLTIGTWLLVTFLTPPESTDRLVKFFQLIRPGGPGWKPIASKAGHVDVDRHLGLSIIAALAAAGIVYLTLPAVGNLIFGRYPTAIFTAGGACACAVVVIVLCRRIGAGSIVK